MKKNDIFVAAVALIMGGMTANAADEEGTLTPLLPDGVKAVIGTDRKPQKPKNLVVAGLKDKGYKAFFAATDSEHGQELWVTDGTPAGTHMVKDIIAGAGGADVSYLTRFNDKVVFSANTDDYGIELWISDGTEEGTYMVKDVNELGDSEPVGFTQLNETQFIFAAKDYESDGVESGSQKWLWVSDGTEEGTKRIKDCDVKYPGQDNNAERHAPFVRVGRKVFFKADNVQGTTGEELWVTDGTTEGTYMVKDINKEASAKGTANAAIDHMMNYYNKKLFFKAWSIESGNEPWSSDGTEEGTFEIANTVDRVSNTGVGEGGNLTFVGATPYKEYVFFRTGNDTYGTELGMTNMEKDNFKVFDINTNEPTKSNESFPDPGVVFDGVYLFCANSGTDATKPETNFGGELHYTDGETVKLQSDLGPGVQCDWVKELTVVSGSLYWWNESTEDAEKKTKIFRINNKDQFPVRVTNLFSDGDMVHSLRNLGGDLIFTTDNEAKQVYTYNYRKPGFNAATDTDDLDPIFEPYSYGGVAELHSNFENVKVYPNPAADQFSFAVRGDAKEVSIYDLSGRLVINNKNVADNTVAVSSLTSGIYNVVITTNEGTYVARLIKK